MANISLFVVFMLIAQVYGSSSKVVPTSGSSSNDIAFELPDLTTIIDTESGKYQLEAYKNVLNDKILKEGDKKKQSQLFWVSVGHIKLLTDKKKGNKSITFHSSDEGYHIHIQALTDYQRKILVETVKMKYNISIAQSQIVNLILSEFYCNIHLFDENGKQTIIKGEVSNFNKYPLRMDFFAPLASKERSVLIGKKLRSLQSNKHFDIRLQCSMSSRGRKIRTNTFTISSKLIEQLKIEEKLFGNSNKNVNEVFVSRNQLANLAGEIYSSMRIVEDYEIPETQFTAEFVEQFIKQTSTSFMPVSLDEFTQKLSKYSTDFSSDLKPDEIKRELSNILMIKTINNKTHLVVNDKLTKTQFENGSNNNKFGISLVEFGLDFSVNYVQQKQKDWRQMNTSINNQLKDLNFATKEDIKWELEGNRIVPKTLNVTKFIKGSFTKKIVFERIRRVYNDAPYRKEFSLYLSEQDYELKDSFESLLIQANYQKENSTRIKNECLAMKKAVLEEIDKLKDQLKLQSMEILSARNECLAINKTSQVGVNSLVKFINSTNETIMNEIVQVKHLQESVRTFINSKHCIVANGNQCPPGYPLKESIDQSYCSFSACCN